MDFEGIPGVMGRSNLRAKAEVGGYNIVEWRTDSIFLLNADQEGEHFLYGMRCLYRLANFLLH